MRRFFRRFFAFMLSLATLGVALFLILQLQPRSMTGWVLYGAALLGAVLGSLLLYRRLMGSDFGDPYPEADSGEGYAPGIMVGAGGQRRRRDDDTDAGVAGGDRADDDADGDDPTGLT